jgi:hypothetical protein
MSFRMNVRPWSMPPWTMRRMRSNYHTLHVLQNASPKLRKAILSSCDKELVNTVSECVLNVLRGNVKLTNHHKRRLSKFKGQLRSLVGRRVSLTAKKSLINQRGGFLIPLLSAMTTVVNTSNNNRLPNKIPTNDHVVVLISFTKMLFILPESHIKVPFYVWIWDSGGLTLKLNCWILCSINTAWFLSKMRDP